ncbi:hypothetical protein JDW19_02415 [Paenibacillus polymyxa]|uniref:Uncharacterized protein n=1 Tax=Paenibacillus polymyxa TaxID=1406 RepID=A0A8I1ILK8_PAEPO|nr:MULTISPECIES: hypothetical protein [Paenibacillus]KAF6576572.1 hypothetical protein G9G53_01280 [Paenibacillus sp. EKM206P]KAF6591294.1 hypothetical protein G9G52_02685 [Paenibacillus sp. EKM205P]MBM0631982.1 hypothetical protein [Paenibacillus polymyxa]
MKVSDVVEEIIEKSPHTLSPASILRKITQVRDRLLRNLGSAQQQSETLCTAIDLIEGQASYTLPCPPSAVTEVTMLYGDQYIRLPLRQFHNASVKPYHYFQAGQIGIVPTPDDDVPYGIKIFHAPVLYPLRFEDMNRDTGFDPDYDMLLVYGVLREITTGNESQEYNNKYEQLYTEYQSASNGYERYSVDERW